MSINNLSTTLTDRERQIVEKIAEGMTSIEIADALFLSPHTVKTHRKNILRKLQIRRAPQILLYVNVVRGADQDLNTAINRL